MSVLSVGRVAGTLEPFFLDLAHDSISSGLNLRTGRAFPLPVDPVGLRLSGVATGVGSGAGTAFLFEVAVVSIGSIAKRLLPGGSWDRSAAPKSAVDIASTFLLLRTEVSTGTGANFLLVFVVVSTGIGANFRRGGVVVPDIVYGKWRKGIPRI